MERDQLVRFLRTTPLLSARPKAMIVMGVECEWFISFYSFKCMCACHRY